MTKRRWQQSTHKKKENLENILAMKEKMIEKEENFMVENKENSTHIYTHK